MTKEDMLNALLRWWLRGFGSGHGRDNGPFASGTPVRADDFAEHLVTKHGDGRLAGRRATLCEQFGNRAIRGALLSEFDR